MPLRKPLGRAVSALIQYQNDDGGIPATMPNQSSGVWTTGSCLEAILLCSYAPVYIYPQCRKMAEFLLDAQLPDGGWSLVNSTASSTLSTGHVLSALIHYKATLTETDSLLPGHLEESITKGLQWLETNQNTDGGWGVEPSGIPDGKLTRIAGIYYALRPYWTKGLKIRDSRIIRDAVNVIVNHQNKDGGWGFISGTRVETTSDVSNTARAVLILLKSGHCTSNSSLVEKACEFIVSKRISKSSWVLGIEGFHAERSHAQNIYHNNTPCDALEALLQANLHRQDAMEALHWLLTTQRDDGIWALQSPDPLQRNHAEVWTWSTSEFLAVVDLASEVLLTDVVNDALKPKSKNMLRQIWEELTK